MAVAVSAASGVTCHKTASSKQHCLKQSPCCVLTGITLRQQALQLAASLKVRCVRLKQRLALLQSLMSLLLNKGDTLLAEEFTYPHVVESFARPRGYKVRLHHSLHTMVLHELT